MLELDLQRGYTILEIKYNSAIEEERLDTRIK